MEPTLGWVWMLFLTWLMEALMTARFQVDSQSAISHACNAEQASKKKKKPKSSAPNVGLRADTCKQGSIRVLWEWQVLEKHLFQE